MDIGDIISKSFKYPIDDLTNFKFVMIFFLLLVIPIFLVVSNIDWRLDIISVILVLIFFLIFPGYNLSVIKKGINQSKTVPSFNIWKNVTDTLKLILLSFVYSIIPLLVFFIVAFATGLFSSLANVESLTESEMLQLMMGYLITVLVSLIVGVIFTILMVVAMARFAHYDSLSQAFEFREVYNDIKKIGIGKIIVWYIVIGIVFGLMTRLGLLFVLLPVVGIVIYLIIILPIAFLFYAYSIGLLYSDIAESDSQNIIENEPVKQIDSKFA